ncbi:terpenoid synthase [Agrocybe pediades]|nr:terpenoid synthase [Agrocybe pediades]
MSPQEYILPDLLREWPWRRRLSPFYAETKQQSSTWVESFKPFSRRGQKAFDACDLNLLANLTYSNRHKEFIRVGCDLMNFYFIYDEYTDVSDPSVAEELANIVIEQMKDELDTTLHPYSHNHVLGGMTREFWKRAKTLARPGSSCFNRFIAFSETYLRAVTQEAHDRAEKKVRSIEEYMELRRDTCGARPTLALIEFGLDLPEEVTSHPVMVSLFDCAVDLIICVNDMHSYVREYSCGLGNHNILTPIMKEHNLGLQESLDWLGSYTAVLIEKFVTDLDRIPSWGPEMDDCVQTYIDGLGQWIRGNDDWSCESKRYHGNEGMRIRDTRVVCLAWKPDNYAKMEDSSVVVDEACAAASSTFLTPPSLSSASSSLSSSSSSSFISSPRSPSSARTFFSEDQEDDSEALAFSTSSSPTGTSSSSSSSSTSWASAKIHRLRAVRMEVATWWAVVTRKIRHPKNKKHNKPPTISCPSQSTFTYLSSPSQWRLKLSFSPTPSHTMDRKKSFGDISFLDMDF